jgi:N-acetylglutamate synthase-like GNAT family acetyltransferase
VAFIVRKATREDIEAFSPMRNKPTLLALAGELDGKIIALGGAAFSQARWYAFCDLTEEARKHKMHIARSAKRFLADARGLGIKYVYAERDPMEPTAERWLASLGFEIDPRTAYLYRWSA